MGKFDCFWYIYPVV